MGFPRRSRPEPHSQQTLPGAAFWDSQGGAPKSFIVTRRCQGQHFGFPRRSRPEPHRHQTLPGAPLGFRLTRTQAHSYSDSCALPLTNIQTHSHPDSLIHRLTHTQTSSCTDSLTHTQSSEDLLILRYTHTQTRHTQTHAYSDLL